ncbi:hypothetical protein RclHR1_04710008 [Rhizophagus clarus]|uniref:HTH CENPB-type domain-containing protein n=1 Tax=Rhizophagus clarus TaxID=94130 RepID=A0A2Z6S0E6_9GLOM|nr:hypothetical protein RclHR1_04710008 [Rhizophagus clarus]
MPVAPNAKRTCTAIIADYFNQQNPGLHIDRSTISKILGKKSKWLILVLTSASKKTFRHREVKYPQVEKALGLWVENANANNLPVSEMMIKEKAFYFAQEFSIPRKDILFSNGWIEKFKKRNNIHCYRLHGEANSVPLETLFEERRKLQLILQDYTLDNIFNADETVSFFDKTHITVLLATNAIGTQKLKLLVIGSSKNPRCLYRVNRNSLPCIYYANSKAWMRSDIFGEWLEYINNKFQIQNRKILLLIDNTSSHFNPNDHNNRVTEHINDNLNLSHVRVHFLLPNTTAHLQPMDAGIIKSFKVIYKQHYIRHIIHQFETNVDLKSNKINVKEVMEYVAQAWNSVKVETIVNCWQKTEILPNNNDDVKEQPLTDAEIVQLIIEEENEISEMNNDDKEEHPVILMQKGFNSLKTWVQFLKNRKVKNLI